LKLRILSINESKGTFFLSPEGFEEIQNPDTDIFRMYSMLPAKFFPIQLLKRALLQLRILLLLLKAVTSLESMSFAWARSSMWEAPMSINGIA
jgi:hypothetical protein